MDTPTQDLWTEEDRSRLIRMGQEVKAFLGSESIKTALTLVRARIYEEWARSGGTAERERLHAEQAALDRLLDALQEVYESGLAAEEARRREEATNDAPGILG